MHLCFGTFCTVLLNNRKNRSVTQEKICRSLFGMLDPGYALNRESSYFTLFAKRQRDLPNQLKETKRDIQEMTERFGDFIIEHLTYDLTDLLGDLRCLIDGDGSLGEDMKKRLLGISEQAEPASFLAQLYDFVVEYTNNVLDSAREARPKARTLLEKAHQTANNVTLSKLALRALNEADYFTLEVCLQKMDNELYMARVLSEIAQQEPFEPSAEYARIFHAFLSGMCNHKYRHEVMEQCLSSGYFAKHPEELLDMHAKEYTSQLYVYKLLTFLCEQNLREAAEKYRELLTHRTYRKRLEAEYPA